MNDHTPTRSLLISLGDERRTMREGYAFLDEKCLLLAGEMLRELRRQERLAETYRLAAQASQRTLRAAVGRHGLSGLQVAPPARPDFTIRQRHRPLLGVELVDVDLGATGVDALPAVHPSPEAQACRTSTAALAPLLVKMAGVSSNLARLLAEYRRTVRRVRALQDVLLPELDQSIAEIDTRLEDLEREDAVTSRMRPRVNPGPS